MHNDNRVKSLHIMLPKTDAYVKSYVFFIEDDKLLKKYNTIWNKASTDIKKEFNEKFFENQNKIS